MRLFIMFFYILICFNLEADIERRGAIDIGSGKTKLLVADVDTDTNHIIKNVFSDGIDIPFSEDLASSVDGSFSPSIQLKAKEAIAKLIQNSAPYEPVKFFAVATEAFRLSNNGITLASEISEELGISIRIISQDEESELGFLTAVEITGVDPEHAVVWDIGGGSIQVSWKESDSIGSYKTSFGKIPVQNLIIRDIQGKSIELNSTPNPISQGNADDAFQLLMEKQDKVPFNLREKIQDPLTKVLGIGAIHHTNIAHSTKSEIYSLEIVDQLIQSRLGFDDNYFGGGPGAKFWVSDLILVRAVMSHLGFKEVVHVTSLGDSHVPAPGNTAGIITTSNYWCDPKSHHQNSEKLSSNR